MIETPTPAKEYIPPAPSTLEEAGLRAEQVEQLLLKSLYMGESTGSALAESLRLAYGMLEPLIHRARHERLIEVRGATGTGTAAYTYALTDMGRDRARQHLDVCQYMGVAPVPLAHYVAYMKGVQAGRGAIDRARVRAAFEHLIVNPAMLDQLGPGINSGKSIFLYGPPGNGKTVIATGVGRAIGGDIYVPHAVDVDGQIIKIFDPVAHQAAEEAAARDSVIKAQAHDRRWERVRRPVLAVGGELTLDMLELVFNPVSKVYEAPLQLKANGGVFVIDDFGRQRVPPHELLNRWIVPLESRVDYLALQTGRKIEVPFAVLIIFATNLKPEGLADEAFLRRIPYKIHANNPTVEEFSRIFELNCRRHGITFDPIIVEYLQRRYYQARGIDMRACHSRDLIDQIVDLCRYHDRTPAITRELLDTVCRSYFIARDESSNP